MTFYLWHLTYSAIMVHPKHQFTQQWWHWHCTYRIIMYIIIKHHFKTLRYNLCVLSCDINLSDVSLNIARHVRELHTRTYHMTCCVYVTFYVCTPSRAVWPLVISKFKWVLCLCWSPSLVRLVRLAHLLVLDEVKHF